jgi:hypothetical protein
LANPLAWSQALNNRVSSSAVMWPIALMCAPVA